MGYKFNPFTGNFDDFNGPDGEFTSIDVSGDITLDDGGTYTTTLQTITPTAARTISFPDATGTVALVGGSSGQLLYNNAGANAGASTLTYDGAILTSSGRFINSYNAVASSPAKAFTGTWFTGGTATTTKPQVLVEPTGTTSTAWSTSGTGLGVNAASGFAGRLLDLQVNGSSAFSVANGTIGFTNTTNPNVGVSLSNNAGSRPGSITIGQDIGAAVANLYTVDLVTTRLYLTSGQITWNGGLVGAASSNADTGLVRSAGGVVKVTNGSSGDGTISGQHRLVGTAPASATATGTAGDIRYDASYIYICTATDTWKRAAITTWV